MGRTSDYRHRIQFQKVTRTRDDRQSSIENWADEFKWWASYDGINASETALLALMGSRDLGRTSITGAKFRMRPIPRSRNVQPNTHRIVTPDGLIWDIAAPMPSNRVGESIIMARRVI